MLLRSVVLTFVLHFAAVSVANEKLGPKKAIPPAIPGFSRFHQDDKASAIEGGQLLIPTLKCRQCHQPKDGKVTAQSAPILDDVGSRVKRSYLRDFIADPHGTKPGTTMPNVFVGLDDAEKKERVDALVQYLAPSGVTHGRPDGKAINAGRDLYGKVGCVACHGTRDAKGDQAELFPTSVPLGSLKAKYTLSTLRTFLENPHQTRPHGRMPTLLNAKEANDVANFLMQGTVFGVSAFNMNYTYYEGSWKSVPDFAKLKVKAKGEVSDFDISAARRLNDCALRFEGYLTLDADGDYTFHTTSDDGSRLWINDKLVVNNDGIHPAQRKSGKTKLTKGTHKVVVGVFNAVGGFELSVEYEGPGISKQNLGPRLAPTVEPAKQPAGTPPDSDVAPLAADAKLAQKGKEFFVSMGCANCHQHGNETKRTNATGLEDLKPMGGCLSDTPKKGIPWYGLSAAQRHALDATLAAPAKLLDVKVVVKQTMAQFNCYACHDRDKIGGVTDEMKKHFTATFKEWGDEASIPPSLTGVGAKLNPTYFKKILEKGAHDRNYMNTRMPGFGGKVSSLVDHFANIDEPVRGAAVALNDPITKVKAAGRQMVGSQAFNCVNCHNFGGVKTEGVQGIDMAIMTERLKKEWFHSYLINPTKFRAGTRMPSSFPDGTTPLKNVLDGKAQTQIEAIWTYLADGKTATIPFGMNKKSIPLIPINEAIIYRNFIQGAGARAIGVGFPERAHLAFDANDLRLAMIWQGMFIDARRHWTDRGVGFEPPMGDNVMNLPAGIGFYILGKDDEAWPTKPAKDLGYRFKGYRLTDDQRPTFMYSFNEIHIEDTPNAIETKSNPMIRRTIMVRTDNPIDQLYYRAAVADRIEAEKDGWYRVNEWRMRIDAAPAPMIRKAGNKLELLVPVRFKDNVAKIVQEYVW